MTTINLCRKEGSMFLNVKGRRVMVRRFRRLTLGSQYLNHVVHYKWTGYKGQFLRSQKRITFVRIYYQRRVTTHAFRTNELASQCLAFVTPVPFSLKCREKLVDVRARARVTQTGACCKRSV